MIIVIRQGGPVKGYRRPAYLRSFLRCSLSSSSCFSFRSIYLSVWFQLKCGSWIRASSPRFRRMKETKVKRGSASADTKEKKAVEKKKALSVKEKKPKKQTRAEAKAKKDPNQPKRPPTPFFIFLEEFRKSFKAENPNVKGVTAVGKACGEKWKGMSDKEKAPYVTKAAQMKGDYDKSMTAYKKKKDAAEEEAAQEESEKSRSEINDDEDEEESEEEEDDDDE